MKHLKNLLAQGLVGSTLAICAGTAMANTVWYNAGSINQHQARQEHRINQGVRHGELTAPEYIHLQQGQNRIQRMENTARADGRVSAHERARILHAQAVQSHRIYRLKHN